mmetsp:Transcript_29394/g.49375  ORF Transcript_29394/g.49375 Transcript_29394/m.49375 type:complete len:573 (+) Transcript_29394:95-1813(+)|eukprot:CAMPEP_0198213086 /NCGR_PEP_ID=MMETSP1445-20131203/28663_1 /TAXON_ID=36898 /ORGANISM="Pyramimonas sp., Strain CCMP2087" /LENGTH=572 /DNA_ID=CAMNT_0043887681 /DNA_START=97 /DNA_END=1815 /DNA_ORIENTATION=+
MATTAMSSRFVTSRVPTRCVTSSRVVRATTSFRAVGKQVASSVNGIGMFSSRSVVGLGKSAPTAFSPLPKKEAIARKSSVTVKATANAVPAPAKAPEPYNGVKIVPALFAISVGLIVRYVIPMPVGVSPQGWQLLSIFLATITGLVAGPLPVGAWAFCGMTFAVVTKTMTFAQAYSAYLNDVIWLIVIAFFFARGFVKTGLGDRVATLFVKYLGSSTLGLAYGLTLSEAAIAPAMPSTTARAGGVYLPIIASLADNAGSKPNDPSARKLGAYLIQTQLQCAGPSSALFMTAAAQNMLTMKLGQEVAGIVIANPWITWLKGACVPAATALLLTPLLMYWAFPPEIKDTPEAPKIAEERLKMLGPLSKDEKVVISVMSCALVLWMAGDKFGIAPAVTAMMGLCAFLCTGVLQWKDCLAETAAWDTLSWFAVLIGMSGMLNQLGVVKLFSDTVAATLAAASLGPFQCFLVLNTVYFVLHYLFASQTAQVGALAPAFIGMLIASGINPMMAIFSIAYNTNLFGGLSHYASGQSAAYFGKGYVTLPDYFKYGAIFGFFNFGLFFSLGIAWWKLIGWL